jgi:hypothetical protein
MDFEEGLNGYSSFLVSVHWQIAGIIFQTGSIETLTAAITKLLFHLPSKKPGSSLRQKLFAGAGNVFVGFSHEDDTADSISGGYDGLDDLGCGWSWLFIHHRDFATVFGTKTFGFSVIDNSFQLAADQFSNEFLTSRTGSSYYLVVVGDAGKHAGGMGEGLGVFFCKKAKLSDWGVFFQNDFTFTVGENFKWGTFFDSQGPTDFFWDDHPAQIIYSSYDSCGFHLSVPPVLYDAIVGNN